MLLVLAALLTACSTGSTPTSGDLSNGLKDQENQGTEANGNHSSGPVHPDLLLTQFPATSAEYNSSMNSAWGGFVTTVQGDITAACVEKEGFTRAQTATLRTKATGTVPPNNLDYPDLARLAKGQTATAVNVSAPGDGVGQGRDLNFNKNPLVPENQRKAYGIAVARCSNKALKPFIPFINALTPLQMTWADMLKNLPSEAAIRAATSQWKNCMSSNGIDTSSPRDFFSQLDQAAMESTDGDLLARRSSKVKIYAKCIEPLATEKDRIRLEYRKTLADKYAPQIAELQKMMNSLVFSLTEEYGLTYGKFE